MPNRLPPLLSPARWAPFAGLILWVFLQSVVIAHSMVLPVPPALRIAGCAGGLLGTVLVILAIRDFLRRAAARDALLYYADAGGIYDGLSLGVLSVVLEARKEARPGPAPWEDRARIVSVNRAACRMLGLPRQALAGRALGDLFYRPPAGGEEQARGRLLPGEGRSAQVLLGGNGALVPARVAVHWFPGEPGRDAGLVLLFPFRGLAGCGEEDGIPDAARQGVYIRTAAGELRAANRLFSEWAGVPPGKAAGTRLGDLFPGRGWGASPVKEARVLFRSGGAGPAAWREVREFLLPGPGGGEGQEIAGVVRDLAADAAELFRRDRELGYLKAVFAEHPLAMVIQGSGGELVQANPAFARLFGLNPNGLEGLAGKSLDDLVCGPGGECLPEANRLTEEVLRGSGDLAVETVRFRADGTPVPVDIRGKRIVLPDDRTAAFVVYVDLSEHRKAKALAEGSAARFRALFDHSRVPIVLYDEARSILEANRAFGALVGVPRESLPGRSLDDFIAAGDLQAARRAHSELILGERAEPVLRTYVRGDSGEFVPVQETPFLCRCGQETEAASIVEDLTAVYRALSDLRREHTYFENLFQVSPAAIAVSAPDGRVLEVNRAFLSLFGYSREEVLGRSLDEVIVPEDRMEEALRLTREVFENLGRASLQETVRRRKDGSPVEVSVEMLPILVDGCLHGAYAVYADLTDRRSVQRQLQESEALHKAIVETQSELVLQIDPQGTVLFANGACSAFFGRGRQALVGESFFRLGVPSEAEECRRKIGVLRPGAAEFQCDMRFFSLAGSERVIKWSGHALFEPRGERIERVLLVGRDVTDYRRAMQELVAAREEAEGALRARSALLSYLSHEIRTPLMTVKGVMGSLRKLAGCGEDGKEPFWYRSVNSATDQIVRVLDSILDLSRLEAGGGRFRMEPVDVRAALGEVLDSFEAAAREKGIEIQRSFHFSGGGRYVTDGVRLRQILFNLVGNAVKYTDSGWIKVTAEEALSDEGPLLFLQVRDTGAGMAREDIPNLFRPFSKGDSERYVPGSVGLGLAITRQIVEGLGGKIAVQSSPGQGSTFRVRIPVRAAEDAPAEVPPPPREEPAGAPGRADADPDGGLPPLRVLVVEDHEVNRELLVQMVRETGSCAVEAAASGREALEILCRESFDLVLLDIMMPGMSGVEVAERWREIEAKTGRGRAAIVGVTAFASAEEHRMFLSAGMDRVVVKPVDPRRLEETVRGLRRERAFGLPARPGAEAPRG